MSSSGQRQPFRFFKIIIDGSLRDRKLMLPKKLRRRLISDGGSDLRWNRPATILVVNEGGLSWEMELWNDEEKGCLWLRKGFHEFAVFYSLTHGHLLLFKHLRDLQFSVRIHDGSAFEIEYPDDDEEDQDSCDEQDEGNFETDDEEDSDFETSHGGRCPGSDTYMAGLPQAPARLRNLNFYIMYMKEMAEMVGVKVGNGEKVWEMKVSRLGKMKNSARITGGWTQFVRDNHLQVGNVCIFNLLETAAAAPGCPLFRVTISRN
ncbi:B3 domain-containing protein Os03g0212300 [Linum grandiflorum]